MLVIIKFLGIAMLGVSLNLSAVNFGCLFRVNKTRPVAYTIPYLDNRGPKGVPGFVTIVSHQEIKLAAILAKVSTKAKALADHYDVTYIPKAKGCLGRTLPTSDEYLLSPADLKSLAAGNHKITIGKFHSNMSPLFGLN